MIPKIIHQIWIGDDPIQKEHAAFIQKWKEMYSEYVHILWDNKWVQATQIIPERKRKYFYEEYPIALKADILRYEILRRFGGIYVDVDTEPLRRMGNIQRFCNFFSGRQPNGQVAIGIIGSEPESRLMVDVCTTVGYNIEDRLIRGCKMEWVDQLTGPEFFTRICKEHRHDPGCQIYDSKFFYPYSFDEMHRRNEDFKTTCPEAYSVHHWTKKWG